MSDTDRPEAAVRTPHIRPDRRAGGMLRCEEGAAILEFALALPILFALVAGAFELGRALLVREIMIEAVRGGARYLARVPDPACGTRCSAGAARAIAITTGQILADTGLAASALTVTSQGDAVSDTVSIHAGVKLDVDLLRLVGLGPFLTLKASHQERRVGE